jgi:hypothetical protein
MSTARTDSLPVAILAFIVASELLEFTGSERADSTAHEERQP